VVRDRRADALGFDAIAGPGTKSVGRSAATLKGWNGRTLKLETGRGRAPKQQVAGQEQGQRYSVLESRDGWVSVQWAKLQKLGEVVDGFSASRFFLGVDSRGGVSGDG
jgi:hypothetical protein